ncbi:MAG TPA: acetolactate synthase large subunit [Syntrophales bacterium]|nr:acetolactate synthase large subunit [Syntrophales bacterium]HOL58645.1 acetolactate synthase large subunit [Syntrophales bacterium]HPO35067.1 acetolactate synthase large subunit [Syntrophales bacterium]
MTAAELMLLVAKANGVEICFANAGTTELPIVAALDKLSGIRPVLGLFEGVCTGAADGYARITGQPAMTLLHLGPGLGNGIANLHNARRARMPVLNIVGEHASWHVPFDAPLTMDIEKLAQTVSRWVGKVKKPGETAEKTVKAILEAKKGGVATLICPADHMGAEVEDGEIPDLVFPSSPVNEDLIEEAARLLTTGRKMALLLGGDALRERGLKAAARIRAKTNCDLLSVTFPAVMDRGAHLPELVRIPYFPRHARKALAPYDAFLLVGTDAPVTFFGYPGEESMLLRKDQDFLRIDDPEVHAAAVALEALADAIAAPGEKSALESLSRPVSIPAPPRGELNVQSMSEAIAALQPEGVVVVEEGLMSGYYYHLLSPSLPPHTVMTLTGGSIGWGLPCALGVALGCPDRPVILLEADGSAMYTVQALWSMAREDVHVITIICNNNRYSTIGYEYKVAYGTRPGAAGQALIDLAPPAIDWVGLGRSLGVKASYAKEAEEFAFALKRALNEPGPHVIEVRL